METADFESEINLIALPETRLPLAQVTLLGFQHVLAMSVYIVPFLIAAVLALDVLDSASFIQSAFVAAGLATLIQSQFCMRFPIVQGPSFVPIGAVLAIAFAAGGGVSGLSVMAGALIPGALVIVLIGWPGRLFHRFVNRFVPPIVGGTIIVVVGIALMPVALKESVFAIHGGATLGQNILLALTSGAVLIGLMLAGIAFGVRATWLRLFSVILALGAGCLLAAALGRLDLSAVGRADWISLPWIAFVTLDVQFSAPAALTMGLVYIVVMAETTGTWFALSAVLNQPLSKEQMDRGAVGEGLGCLVSALLCSVPVTGYSTNAGIVAITGIASRMVFAAAGVLLVLFGLIGKLSALIASVPGAVIGGVFCILCAVIAMNGFRVIRHIPMNERNMLVIGLPILMSLAATLMPQEFIKTLPNFLQYVLGSSIAFGALWAILLQQILPDPGRSGSPS